MKRIVFFLVMILCLTISVSGQTYGTGGTGWTTNGNRILDRNYIGTNNAAPLNFKTSGTLRGWFDKFGGFNLLLPDYPNETDSVLTIVNKQVFRKINPITPSRNGLNNLYDRHIELGGELLRETVISTKANQFTVLNDKVMNIGGNRANTFAIATHLSPLQSQHYRAFNVQLNLSNKVEGNDFDIDKNFIIYNQFTSTSLPANNWIQPIINFHSGIDRAIANNDNEIVKTKKADNVINAFIGTTFDAWPQYSTSKIDRYLGLMLGYRLPYKDNLPENNKFTTRVELAINPAPDTTSIPNNVDIYISNGTLNAYNNHFPIPGKHSIYQANKKPNTFFGSITSKDNLIAERALIIPVHAAAQSQNIKGNIFYDDEAATAKIVDEIGSLKKLLTFDTKSFINQPYGGAVIDVEARAAIISIINTLVDLGLIQE